MPQDKNRAAAYLAADAPKMDLGHVSACFMILVNEDVTTVYLVCQYTHIGGNIL